MHGKGCFEEIPAALSFGSQRFLRISLKGRQERISQHEPGAGGLIKTQRDRVSIDRMEARHDIGETLSCYPESGGAALKGLSCRMFNLECFTIHVRLERKQFRVGSLSFHQFLMRSLFNFLATLQHQYSISMTHA